MKEGESFIADKTQVCERMNTFFVNIAQNIGIDCDTPVNEEHPSIIKIKENANVSDFDFSPVTESQVKKYIIQLDPKKQLVLAQSHQKQLKKLPQLSQGILPKCQRDAGQRNIPNTAQNGPSNTNI